MDVRGERESFERERETFINMPFGTKKEEGRLGKQCAAAFRSRCERRLRRKEEEIPRFPVSS